MAPAGLAILTTTFSQGTDRSRALGAWGAVSGLAAATGGFQRALLACAFFLLAAAVIGLRAANTRGEPAPHPDDMPASHDRIPAPELTD